VIVGADDDDAAAAILLCEAAVKAYAVGVEVRGRFVEQKKG
jgi:hypothetical protein